MAVSAFLAPNKRVPGIDTDDAQKRRIAEAFRLIDMLTKRVAELELKYGNPLMAVESEPAETLSQLMARVARLETKRGPGRPPKVEAT